MKEMDRQSPSLVAHSATTPPILVTPRAELAAYLLVRGRPLVRVEDTDRMLSFVFTDVGPGDVEAFHGGDLVPAIDFARASAKVHQIIRARRVERNVLRQHSSESEVPSRQKERRRSLATIKGFSAFAAVALLVVVAGCATRPAQCAPYGGVLSLDRADCPLPAEPAPQKERGSA